VLLCLLTIGVLTAAIAGQVGSQAGPATASAMTSSPGRWVSQLLSATARAGSAHFAYTEATTSSNPLLSSTVSGAGVVDFPAGRVRVHEVEQHVVQQVVPGPTSAVALPHTQASHPEPVNVLAPAGAGTHEEHDAIDMVGLGKLDYERLGGLDSRWLSMGDLRDPHAQLGLEFVGDAAVALGGLEGTQPVAAVQRGGHGLVDGTVTTRYLVTNAPPGCEEKTTNIRIPAVRGATAVWVDDEGRLVRARYTFSYTLPQDPAKAFPSGTTKTTATLTFSRFGAPVAITTPSPLMTAPGSSKSFALRLKCAGSH
jgi:hypothetical protein